MSQVPFPDRPDASQPGAPASTAEGLEPLTLHAFSRRLAERSVSDIGLAGWLLRLGPTLGYDADPPVTPWLALRADRPMRLHLRLDPVPEAARDLLAVRFTLESGGGEPPLPLLDATPDSAGRWIASRRFGAWSVAAGRRLGVEVSRQGPSGEVGRAAGVRVRGHARHSDGHLLWFAAPAADADAAAPAAQWLAVLHEDPA